MLLLFFIARELKNIYLYAEWCIVQVLNDVFVHILHFVLCCNLATFRNFSHHVVSVHMSISDLLGSMSETVMS